MGKSVWWGRERGEGRRAREKRMRGTGHSGLPLVLLFTSDPSRTNDCGGGG